MTALQYPPSKGWWGEVILSLRMLLLFRSVRKKSNKEGAGSGGSGSDALKRNCKG